MNNKINNYRNFSLLIYIAVIAMTLIVLLFEPAGFDARAAILPLIVLLFLSALGIGQGIARKGSTKLISIIGMIAIAILLTFVGFFIVAGAAWFIGVTNAS